MYFFQGHQNWYNNCASHLFTYRDLWGHFSSLLSSVGKGLPMGVLICRVTVANIHPILCQATSRVLYDNNQAIKTVVCKLIQYAYILN